MAFVYDLTLQLSAALDWRRADHSVPVPQPAEVLKLCHLRVLPYGAHFGRG